MIILTLQMKKETQRALGSGRAGLKPVLLIVKPHTVRIQGSETALFKAWNRCPSEMKDDLDDCAPMTN